MAFISGLCRYHYGAEMSHLLTERLLISSAWSVAAQTTSLLSQLENDASSVISASHVATTNPIDVTFFELLVKCQPVNY